MELKQITFLVVLLSAFITGCRQPQVDTGQKVLSVSILPQKYLTQKIAGDLYQVQVMMPAGSNHETYEPTPSDIASLQTAKYYVSTGLLDFEKNWIPRFQSANHNLAVINTSTGIELIGGHTHERHVEDVTADPHIWLSPSCMKIMAATIALELEKADSIHKDYYRQNLEKFRMVADSVDKEIKAVLGNHPGKAFMIFHPALSYFARDYQLEQIGIEHEGKEPSAAKLRELIEKAKEKQIRGILISREFDTRNAKAIAREIGAKLIIFDPMDENWPANMIHIAHLISEI